MSIDPTFFVIGAAKCGTTSVCDLLASHPDVFMSDPKEPHFFSRLTRYRELRPWYASLFEGARRYRAVGEGSTSYSHPHRIDFVVPRIRRCLPDARFIYMVRHPIRRLESDWKMRLREDRISESITEAVDNQASLVTFGLYWKHLCRYREAFSNEQILVVFLEDLAAEPARELSRMYAHIGVDRDFTPDRPGRRRNASGDYREDTVLGTALRQVPGASAIKKATPKWVSQLVKRTVTRDFEPVPRWEPAGLEAVRDLFREDSRQLLRYCGKAEDFWSFDGQTDGETR